MSGKHQHTHPILVFLTLCLCLLTGFLITQSSSDLEGISDVSENSESTIHSTGNSGHIEKKATPTPAATGTDIISPEAALGKWVPSDDKWTFQVDGVPITGWLHDSDGKIYYFNKNGIMATGWINYNGNKYYMDEDGILQTGKLTIDGKVYLFSDTGVMEGYAEATPTPAPDPTPTPIPVPKAELLPNGKKPAIALTFDDGPGIYADRILDCLEKYHSKATFFMLGSLIPSYPDQVKRMEALGCELGNHSYDHKDLVKLTEEEVKNEIRFTNQEIEALVGHPATVVRPPYGSFNSTVSTEINSPIILWSIDTLDWSTKDPDATVQAAVASLGDGSVILMHEIYEESAKAVETLVPMLVEAGYQLVTIQEMADLHGVTLSPGIAYGDFS